MTASTKVLIVEPDQFFGSMLQTSLQNSGYEVAYADDLTDAQVLAAQFNPRVIIGELRFASEQDPIRIHKSLQRKSSSKKVDTILLTNITHPRLLGYKAHSLPSYFQYLVKSQVPHLNLVIDTIENAVAGYPLIGLRHDRRASTNFPSLTTIQLQVLELVAQGFTNQQISELRGTTPRAVETLLSRAMQTLNLSDEPGLNGRVTMVLHYLRANGLLKI